MLLRGQLLIKTKQVSTQTQPQILNTHRLSSPHLSLEPGPAQGSLVGPVRAGAGPVGADVGAQPVGQALGLDGQTQLLFHEGREAGEVVQRERARRGEAGHQGRAADVGQRRTWMLQHHSVKKNSRLINSGSAKQQQVRSNIIK